MALYRPAEYVLQDVLYVADNGRSLSLKGGKNALNFSRHKGRSVVSD
jgi:hypothetical protein